MPNPIARYSVSFGLAGCYVYDTYSGPHITTTRKELASFIKGELDFYGMPKSYFKSVKITEMWKHIKRHGSSSLHFRLEYKGFQLSFHGLTEMEANSMEAE